MGIIPHASADKQRYLCKRACAYEVAYGNNASEILGAGRRRRKGGKIKIEGDGRERRVAIPPTEVALDAVARSP